MLWRCFDSTSRDEGRARIRLQLLAGRPALGGTRRRQNARILLVLVSYREFPLAKIILIYCKDPPSKLPCKFFLDNNQFVKKLQTAKVCSMIQCAHAIHAPNCIGPPRAASSSTPSPLYCGVPKVVNGGENNSQKTFVTRYLCARFWKKLEDMFNFINRITYWIIFYRRQFPLTFSSTYLSPNVVFFKNSSVVFNLEHQKRFGKNTENI